MGKIDLLRSSLSSAITKTLEDMTFDEVEIDDEPSIVDTSFSDHFWAMLPLESPLSAELVLDASPIYARQLADDIYGGTEAEFSDKTVRDVLAEVLNTVAGSFIKELVPDDQVFEIGLPTTGIGTKNQREAPITEVRANVGNYYLTAFISGTDSRELNLKPSGEK
jgi:CheY-specific phosphatase CheX